MAKADVVTMQPATRSDNARLVVTLGRGARGKTIFLSWIWESSPKTRRLRVLDADPDRPTLSRRIPGAERSTAPDGDDRRIWLEQQIEHLVECSADPETRYDMLLDVGGSDQLMKRLGDEVQFVDALEDAGVSVTAVHLIGPLDEDLAYLRDVEQNNLFCPKRTVIVLNDGLISGSRSSDVAFAHVAKDKTIASVIARGGKMVAMPALGCMTAMEEKGLKTFASGCDPKESGIGMFNATRVRKWLNDPDGMPFVRDQLGDWIP